MRSVERIINKTTSKYNMLNPTDKIVVGLSGGKDSITLLYNLKKIQENTYHSKPLIALSINEGIENYRIKSIESAKKFCNKHNIKHVIVNFKDVIGMSLQEIVEKKRNTSNYRYACNYCSAFRRRILNDKAKELGATVLALGHNLTDLSETFLMNILYKRLNLIANQFVYKEDSEFITQHYVKKITPLMRVPEEEIEIYAKLMNFDHYASHCPFRLQDPIVRKRVLDFIQDCKEFSPEIEFNLFKSFMEISEVLNKEYNKKTYHSCQNCGYPCGPSELCSYCSFLRELN